MSGITGSSDDNYVKLLVQCIQREHYGAVVMNARGRGGLKLKTPRGYSAAFTDDLREVVMHIRSKYPRNPLFAVGVSLGSIILVKYLDEYKEACGLNAAV
jgi:predicted alpha/beta-fold hydrolase